MTSEDSKANEVDMTAAGIEARLRRVSQLRALCLSLGKATIIRDAETQSGEPSETDGEQR